MHNKPDYNVVNHPVKAYIDDKLKTSGSDGGGSDMENRLTALETRFDTILPTLATKTDVAELRADVHKISSDISKWMLATMITIIGTMLAAIFGVSQIYKASTQAAPSTQSAPIIINVPSQAAPQQAAPLTPPQK